MRPIVHWFIDNPIAANLLMIIIIVGGVFNYFSIGKEVFPLGDTDSLSITVAYPGASPSEIEQQVVIRIEEAIADLDGIDEIVSVARESLATITVKTVQDYDTQRLLNNVNSRIDALTTLPEDVDDIEVREVIARIRLMNIAIYGDVAESVLKDTSEWVQQELLSLNEVSNVDIEGIREREMSIEVSENTLRTYNLRFDEIATAIRDNSINIAAGAIKSDVGDVQLQTRGQAFTKEDFENIVIDTGSNNSQLTLSEIATIKDAFEEVNQRTNFNGEPVAYLQVYTANPPDIVNASDGVRETLDKLRGQFPATVKADIWFDWAVVYKSRMKLLVDNTLMGLVLVFVILMLFLRPSLAAWVCVGIATAFLGTFALLPYTGVTLNIISMYGFLLVLGIVVDDAIVVGESIYFSQRKGLSGKAAAKVGAMWVNRPVVFAVISTMIFFAVMFAIDGPLGTQAIPIATVVIVCLLFSLIESMFILPSHLSHAKSKPIGESPNRLAKIRAGFSRGLETLANNYYQKFLSKTLVKNGSTLAFFLMIFLITLTVFLSSGYLKKAFAPVVPSTRITINAFLAEGAGFNDTKKIQQQIEDAAYLLSSDKQMLDINGDGGFVKAIRSSAIENVARVDVRLTPSEDRKINVIQVKDRWRELIGTLSGVKELSLRFTISNNQKDLRFRISIPGNDVEQLNNIVRDVREALGRYEDIYQIEDNLEGARTEIELQLKPNAAVLGLSLADVARQMRQGYFGEEVQRIPRGTDDIKVMLRYPLSERSSIDTIRETYIRTSDGRSVPLNEVADVVEIPGYTKIQRENRRRAVAVTAEVNKGVDTLALANTIIDTHVPELQRIYRGLSVEIDGAVADEKEFNAQILQSFILAFLLSFGLMAIVFRSCWQPVLILTAVPFGFVGAVFGHLFLDITMTMNSLLGFIACAGVVVNDNLVLLDRIHQLRDEGKSVHESITQAGADRFRAIVLTSVTTFVGLVPILSETSIQAQFMIPMVVSLAFGVLFATVVTLFFVPNLYLFGERCNGLLLKTEIS